ncbi:uncharacterized protein FIBRA_04978 [Fibroporia radiculosa]|uniref:Transcriptional regulatory protein n=1 Tax=Fibroporia radiculosa TaxID=599839 RepID=J4IAG4_9APHY|nr:uncharacterized protein FIBRA_04978 [Fibroporia radiculosa]CCM02866.1 predicted protein [Fibroporia radiculosa]
MLRLSLPSTSLRRSFFTSSISHSGHNKWSKIKERKGANDLRKGVLYSKANKDILLAVRTGGSVDPEQNATLAAVIKKVKSQGVPKDNIENALKKAAGGKDKGDQQLTYEAMAPGSVGMIIECMSDNVNRTMHALRNILTDHEARLAPVGFLFARRGCVRVSLEKGGNFEDKLDQLIGGLLDSGVEDFKETVTTESEAELELWCQPQDLAKVTNAAMESGFCSELLGSELIYTPLEKGPDIDADTSKRLDELVDTLEDHDDVLRVWTTHNA